MRKLAMDEVAVGIATMERLARRLKVTDDATAVGESLFKENLRGYYGIRETYKYPACSFVG